MSLRFGLGSLFLVAGGFLVAASLAFSAGTAGWLAFAVSTGVAVLAAIALARAGSGRRAVGYGAAFAVGLWSLIAALVFSGTTLTWLVFADAVALAVVALADLVRHEISTERVVHTLEVREHADLASAV